MPKRRNKNTKADLKIRMDEALRSKIERSARENNRTMNAEMALRLELSFKNFTGYPPTVTISGGPQGKAVAVVKALEPKLVDLITAALTGKKEENS